MSCCLPELEQYRAMDDMADWGVKHLKDESCNTNALTANPQETAQEKDAE